MSQNLFIQSLVPAKEDMAHYIPRKHAGIPVIDILDWCVKNKTNVLTFGNAGTGKSELATWYASERGLPLAKLSAHNALSANEMQGN